MGKNLGTVNYSDNKTLLKIVGSIPEYSKFSESELPYHFDCDAVWEEAKQYCDENDVKSAEIRVNKLDFVFVNLIPKDYL